ncbi:hypothetical protein K488DRAFT_71280 [Vararia minispora EC-137]|uniref:Uncharacterized protein n=1 Tax=Vararia minispora EC-137 TaxID=1314806 RepID=A0ACB8QIN4_9AGAM|nr:hypothetical protein K488DRAFT_71280 [Vararia minispora EC-137]
MIFSAEVDGGLAAVIAATVFLVSLPRLRDTGRPNARQERAVTALLVLHTLYTAYRIFTGHPWNIFEDLGLGLKVTPAALRERVRVLAVRNARFAAPGMDDLLSKLSSFEMRLLLVRYGPGALHAPGTDQRLALFAALPGPILSYILRATLVGLLTLQGSGRERRRKACATAIVGAFCAELYYLATADIDLAARPAFMPHAVAWSVRQLFFLVLPALVLLFPPLHSIPGLTRVPFLRPRPPAHAHAQLATALERVTHRLNFARYSTHAVRRDGKLAARAEAHWAAERELSEHTWAGAAVRSQVQAWKTVGLQPPARQP